MRTRRDWLTCSLLVAALSAAGCGDDASDAAGDDGGQTGGALGTGGSATGGQQGTGGGTGGAAAATGGALTGGAATGGAASTGGVSATGGAATGGASTGGEGYGGAVTFTATTDGWQLMVGGAPYVIRGIGGQHRLADAAALGANSTRTWGSENAASVLADAGALQMTVMLGLWLSHSSADFESSTYKDGIRAELAALLEAHADDPALLFWGLGNEIQLGANTPAAWQFVEELAQQIHAADSLHPVATVLADAPTDVLSNVATYAPSIDVLGVNSYAGVLGVADRARSAGWAGPIVVTEWGPNGHWEVASTSWGRPLEPTSAEKASQYAERAAALAADPDVVGSYVFLWGQKQERTPTWYGMFVEDRAELGLAAESCPTVDVMAEAWSGAAPANVAPSVTALTLDGQTAGDGVTLSASATASATVTATDANGDALSYVWELLAEPSELGEGGSFEPRPATIAGAIAGSGSTVTITAPPAGEYRLFAYVLDGQGHVGTANVPFLVE